jgi:ribonuclease HI
MPAPSKIYFDGGCRPNPGTMEIAVVVAGQAQVRRDCGQGSSMDAEWLALIEALALARALDLSDFILLGDAIAVIAQASGKARCPGRMQRHLMAFRALAGCGPPPRIRYVKRTQNLAGIALAKLHPR